MACVGIKRPFDAIHESPGHSSHCMQKPLKRRRRTPMCVPALPVNNAPFTLNPTPNFMPPCESKPGDSPFDKLQMQFSMDDITSYIRHKIRRLKRRRLLVNSLSSESESSHMEVGESSFSSPGDYLQCLSSKSLIASEDPVFSVKEATNMCIKVIIEQEKRLRQQYKEVLEQRKSEQYDSLVRFTTDQTQPISSQDERPTYLS